MSRKQWLENKIDELTNVSYFVELTEPTKKLLNEYKEELEAIKENEVVSDNK